MSLVDTSIINPAQFQLAPETSNITNQLINILGQRRTEARAQKVAQAKQLQSVFKTAGAQMLRVRDIGDMSTQRKELAKLGQAAIQRGEDPSVFTDALNITDPDELNLYLTRIATQTGDADKMLEQGLKAEEPTEQFEPVLDEAGNVIAQRNIQTGQVIADPRAGTGKKTASRKDYELAKSEGFTGDFIDYKQAVSGVGPKTELEMLKLRAQISDIEQRQSDRIEKKRIKSELKDKKARTIVAGIDSLLDEVSKAKTQAKEDFTATGLTGVVTGVVPGSPSYNLRKRIETVKANIGFDRLQQMRDASPTGGALGQVAVQELNALQNSITALDPALGDDELIAALDKVERHYTNWKKTLIGEEPETEQQVPAAGRFQIEVVQ